MGPAGPLNDVRVVDISALAPGPFCTMILADFGADVIAIEPVSPPLFEVASWFNRGKRSVLADLRHPDGVGVVARLAASADVFVEGSRPGAMERLGLGPDDLQAVNPSHLQRALTHRNSSAEETFEIACRSIIDGVAAFTGTPPGTQTLNPTQRIKSPPEHLVPKGRIGLEKHLGLTRFDGQGRSVLRPLGRRGWC